MSEASGKTPRVIFLAPLCALWSILAFGQQLLPPEAVPPNFNADALFAARIRALMPPSNRPTAGGYATGKLVLDQLTRKLAASQTKFSWDLRLAKDAGNMFSSPDGTIFVDEELAQLLGPRSGLWAAALSHEIAHVVRRDWARRYLFQKSLQISGTAQVVIGDAGPAGASWIDSRTSATLFAYFCQKLELEADAAGLMIMARAGFHPAFMPALYHLLQAQPRQLDEKLLDSSHPPWNDREEKLHIPFAAAGKEFDDLWPDRFASPGGNPPIVVYSGLPLSRRNLSGELEMSVPLHCDNLYGSVAVVLRLTTSGLVRELRQYTGCTSNHTFVTFTVSDTDGQFTRSPVQAMISILDDRGSLLARSLAPKRLR